MSKVFKAKMIQNGDMDAGYIEIPFDVEKEYGAKRVKVLALLNGIEYRGSLVRMKSPCHILGIPKVVRSQMGADFGDIIEVELEKDEEPRTVELPDGVKKALGTKAVLAFKKLSYTKQKQFISELESARREETREKRIKAMIDKITK